MERQQRDPGDIIAISVAGHGWAYVREDLIRLYRAWTGERVGQLDEPTLGVSTGRLRCSSGLSDQEGWLSSDRSHCGVTWCRDTERIPRHLM